MQNKMDFLFTVEVSTGHLGEASKALNIIIDNLYRDLMVCKKLNLMALLDSTECHYAAIYTILRDINRTQEDLESAIHEYYQGEGENSAQKGGE